MIRFLPFLFVAILFGCSGPRFLGTYHAEIDTSQVAIDRAESAKELMAFFENLSIELKPGGRAIVRHGQEFRETKWKSDGEWITIEPPTEGGLPLTLKISPDGRKAKPEFTGELAQEMAGIGIQFVKR